MIAPIRRPAPGSARSHRGLATARRAVATALFRGPAPLESGAPRVPKLLAWLFVAWTLAVAASYFTPGAWWTIGRY